MNDKTLVVDNTEELPETVKFAYTEAPDYKIIYANGVYGGLTGKDELRFDFFQEFRPAPSEEVHEITEEGKPGLLVSEDRDAQQLELIREKQINVVMTISAAKALYKWLEDKLETYDALMEAKQKGGIRGE